ncbi:MAG: zf-HC2 domain-containing protein [Blastocatellia bacterium]
MNCRRIEKLIPLYVECDLDHEESGAVLAHLNACESCSALIREYEASQSWLRSNTLPDFDDAVLDDLKRSVMRGIDEARARPSLFGFFSRPLMPGRAFAAVAALLIIFAAFALYIYQGRSGKVTNDTKVAQESIEPEKPAAPEDLKQAPVANSVIRPHRVKRYARSAIGRNERTVRDRVLKPGTDNPVAQKTRDVPTETEEMMRIEIQTGDPNIRIIWFSPKESDSQLSNPMIETD